MQNGVVQLLSALWKSLLLLLAVSLATPAFAQDVKKPVMENVFFNVVWGSAFGATIGLAISVIGSEDKSKPTDARNSSFSGATVGGLIGLGIGLYLVYQGITFERAGSTVTQTGSAAPPVDLAALADPPFQLVTAADDPRRITGFKARVLNLRF